MPKRGRSVCLTCVDKHATRLCGERLSCNKPSFLPGLAEFSFRCRSTVCCRPLMHRCKEDAALGCGRGRRGGWWEPRALPPPAALAPPSSSSPALQGGPRSVAVGALSTLRSLRMMKLPAPRFCARHTVEIYPRFLRVLMNESGIL